MNDNPLGLDETKPELSENGSGESVYKENESQSRGEYHQPVNEENQNCRQNDCGQGPGQGNFGRQTYPYQEPYQPVSQGFGIASMILGIISLALFCSCVNILLAIAAIIFGIIQLATPGSKKGMAVAGLITSGLSILLFIIFSVTFVISTDFQDGFQQGFRQELQNGPDEDFSERYDYEYQVPDFEFDEDTFEYKVPDPEFDDDTF